jgi:hypothetical protein
LRRAYPPSKESRYEEVFIRCMRRLPVTANVPSSPILVTMIMEALSSSETSVLTRATRRNIPEGGSRKNRHFGGTYGLHHQGIRSARYGQL